MKVAPRPGAEKVIDSRRPDAIAMPAPAPPTAPDVSFNARLVAGNGAVSELHRFFHPEHIHCRDGVLHVRNEEDVRAGRGVGGGRKLGCLDDGEQLGAGPRHLNFALDVGAEARRIGAPDRRNVVVAEGAIARNGSEVHPRSDIDDLVGKDNLTACRVPFSGEKEEIVTFAKTRDREDLATGGRADFSVEFATVDGNWDRPIAGTHETTPELICSLLHAVER